MALLSALAQEHLHLGDRRPCGDYDEMASSSSVLEVYAAMPVRTKALELQAVAFAAHASLGLTFEPDCKWIVGSEYSQARFELEYQEQTERRLGHRLRRSNMGHLV